MVMDPWQVDGSSDLPGQTGDTLAAKKDMAFEDHFQPFAKLPDSDEYLASLENKLQRVQRGSKTGASLSSQEIIRSLEQNHDSCMMRLLTNSVQNLNGIESDELRVNPVLKKLAPEKQAVSVEELVHLVKADQLAILLDDEGNSSENIDQSEKAEVPEERQKKPESSD